MDISSHAAEVSVLVQSSDQDAEDELRRNAGRRGARTERLELAKVYVEDNLHRTELTPVGVAAALGISVRQLHMLFEPTGTSFSSYLLLRRLERARVLLVTQPESRIMEVACACGIRSSTVFYRGFQRAFGVTPTVHRRTAAAGGADGSPPKP